MKIEPKSIKVKDIFDGYADNGDKGVTVWVQNLLKVDFANP